MDWVLKVKFKLKKMGKDKTYKATINHLLKLDKSWELIEISSLKLSYKYSPDKCLRKKATGEFLIIEQSSTGDRKVNIGELVQAAIWLCEKKAKGMLVYILTGNSSTSSTPKTLKKYLQPYYEWITENISVDLNVLIKIMEPKEIKNIESILVENDKSVSLKKRIVS